jgi:hypothetical protein
MPPACLKKPFIFRRGGAAARERVHGLSDICGGAPGPFANPVGRCRPVFQKKNIHLGWELGEPDFQQLAEEPIMLAFNRDGAAVLPG